MQVSVKLTKDSLRNIFHLFPEAFSAWIMVGPDNARGHLGRFDRTLASFEIEEEALQTMEVIPDTSIDILEASGACIGIEIEDESIDVLD